MLFSKRKKLSSVRDTVQKDDVDLALRHGLWNALHICLWLNLEYSDYRNQFSTANFYHLFQHYWHNLFKLPLDNLPDYFDRALERVRKHFLECDWFEVYDFVEFTAQNCPDEFRVDFIKFCNQILEKELSAYRFVDVQLVDITSEEEIESIEAAITSTNKYSGAKEHLRTALGFISDRKSPDYRNSVKESISAVESLCVSLTGESKATLGSALNKIEESHRLHPAFKKALSNLYGYTSDSDGIRHALLEENDISYSDAKFMLVSCSAFINYVLGKSSEKV
jgi:hypothetical protein